MDTPLVVIDDLVIVALVEEPGPNVEIIEETTAKPRSTGPWTGERFVTGVGG